MAMRPTNSSFDLVKPRVMVFLVTPRSAVNWVACKVRWVLDSWSATRLQPRNVPANGGGKVGASTTHLPTTHSARPGRPPTLMSLPAVNTGFLAGCSWVVGEYRAGGQAGGTSGLHYQW